MSTCNMQLSNLFKMAQGGENVFKNLMHFEIFDYQE